MFKFKTGDFILIIILIALSATTFIQNQRNKQPGTSVMIFSANTLIKTVKLNEDKQISIDGAIGSTELCIYQGKAFITDSPCPYHFCEKSGTISQAGQMLVCVPNKIVIKISGNLNHQLDAVTQ